MQQSINSPYLSLTTRTALMAALVLVAAFVALALLPDAAAAGARIRG